MDLVAFAALMLAMTGEQDWQPRGVAGVCIRWATDPDHVADAVVVVSSGDPRLDQALPATIKNMQWPHPTGAYKGEWVGIVFAVGGASAPDQPLPKCDQLRAPDESRGAAST